MRSLGGFTKAETSATIKIGKPNLTYLTHEGNFEWQCNTNFLLKLFVNIYIKNPKTPYKTDTLVGYTINSNLNNRV